MFLEGVRNHVSGAEEDEDGICKGGTEGGLGAATGVCNPVGEG